MASLDIQNFLLLALKLERNGVDFFNHWAEKAETEELRVFFKMLADEEEQHIRDLMKIASDYRSSGITPEISRALREFYDMFSEKVMFSHKEFESIHDLGKAIEIAKKQEIDAQLFYTELKKLIDKQYHDIVERIITEEQNHYSWLINLAKKMNI